MLLYYVIFLNISLLSVIHLIYLFSYFFLYATNNPILGYHLYVSTNNSPTPIYPQKIQFALSEEKRPSPKHLSKLVNKNTLLNLNIASYFLNILASSDVSTWFTTGGPINKTIKHLALTIHHLKTVERTWHMVNRCRYMEQEYTGNNCTRHLGQPYLLSNPDELNILADAMEKKLGLHYTTDLINFHRHHKGFHAVCRSTVHLAFLILQPKRTRIHKIQQGTKNGGKWKEARHPKTKQWLIMTNRLTEDKE